VSLPETLNRSEELEPKGVGLANWVVASADDLKSALAA